MVWVGGKVECDWGIVIILNHGKFCNRVQQKNPEMVLEKELIFF